MTTIYLVRHAEAEGNLFKRAQGHYNANLTKHGKEQLEFLKNRFLDVDVDLVYASDLKRAFQTAKSIADIKGLETIPNKNLREINMGTVEDLTWGEFHENFKEESNLWMTQPLELSFKNGESTKGAMDRFFNEVLKIVKENSGKNIVIGAHGAVIRYFNYKVLGLSLNDINALEWCDNTSVCKVLFDDEFNPTIKYYNDTTHLKDFPHTFIKKHWKDMTEDELFSLNNVNYASIDFDTQHDILCDFIEDLHINAYGNSEKFKKDDFIEECKKSIEILPNACRFVTIDDKIVGVLRADVLESTDKVGYLGNIAISKKYRGGMIAPQMIGELCSIYRKLSKEVLRTRVSKDNKRAIGFYEKMGFYKNGEMKNDLGDHFIMDYNL